MNMTKETKMNSLQVVGTLYPTMVAMILTQILLLLYFKTTESAKNTTALPGCPESCGGIPIPYPFGIGQNCYVSTDVYDNSTCKTLDGPNCFKEGFDVNCYIFEDDNISVPFYHSMIERGLDYWVFLNISLSSGQVRVRSPLSWQCYNRSTEKDESWIVAPDFVNMAPFKINTEKNKFTVTGCNTLAYLTVDDHRFNYSVGCFSSCNSIDAVIKHGSCSGIGCCQTDIPEGASTFMFSFDERFNNSDVYDFSVCSYALVVEAAQFKFKFNTTYIPDEEDWFYDNDLGMVLDWAIGNMTCEEAQTNKSSYACISSNSICLTVSGGGYLCNCSDGYEGNPYLHGGCQDIDECAIQNPCSKRGKCHNLDGGYRCSCPLGWLSNHNNLTECDLNAALVTGMTIMLGFATAVSIILLSFIIAKRIKLFEKRKQEKLKQKFFIQNRGLLLQQLIASHEDTTQKMRNFGLHELEKATNNFDNALILGRGGHGEVYKGILSDQRVVAIKKSKIVDQAEIDQFINEVVILSQVNHRNVVKLYGCCLETEVPLLVYEFISNGTLFNHLHVEEQCSLTWKHRLRIALEAAGAISYLHSSASISVFHRDIKSSNILLDDYFTAKVSDFGASRSVQIDQTSVTTNIQGTHGYLDPEYYYTCRLTPKSDVYSFGVILAELLTREKPLISSRVNEGGSLIAYFRSAMRENRLFEILDPQVVNEGHRTELEAMAKLAEICLRMKGDERPSMKEVEIRLEVLWRSNQQQIHPWRSQSLEERQLMLLDYNRRIDTETLLSEQSFHDNGIGHTCNYFNIDKEAEESIAIGR